ncbi:MAG: MarR family winged helix-turn-helix transcriptional regulator [Rhodospirillaceae bacterium]
MANPKTLDATIRSIRACFSRLKATGDALHADVGVTSAMRAVMEYLAENGAKTVPDVAKAKRHSRQHIQTLADILAADGLLKFKKNPEHKRSNLMQLTARGNRTFAAMKEREALALRTLSGALQEQDLATTLRTLTSLQTALEEGLNERQDNDSDQ